MIDLEAPESRYDRQERITWWDQDALSKASVLVVGAGALGNEIVKNLSLVGVGNIHIIDMDRIELTNLARCALFRDSDEGAYKAEALASAAAALNRGLRITFDVCTVQEFGSGSLDRFDIIIAGLDNLEARLWVNHHARRLGKTWIDGAIEGLQGVVRAFPPSGACLECTLSETDRLNLSHRRSCALLTPEELISGKTPTNSTSASVVAAFEVQEAIKLLVGRDDLLAINNQMWRFDGETMHTSLMGFFEDEFCPAHFTYEKILPAVSVKSDWLALTSSSVNRDSHEILAVDFEDDLIEVSACESCVEVQPQVGLQSLFSIGAGRCASCNADLTINSFTSLAPSDFESLPPMETWYWPKIEIVTVRGEGFEVAVPLERTSNGQTS